MGCQTIVRILNAMEQNNFFKIIPLATNAAYTPTLGWFVNKINAL